MLVKLYIKLWGRKLGEFWNHVTNTYLTRLYQTSPSIAHQKLHPQGTVHTFSGNLKHSLSTCTTHISLKWRVNPRPVPSCAPYSSTFPGAWSFVCQVAKHPGTVFLLTPSPPTMASNSSHQAINNRSFFTSTARRPVHQWSSTAGNLDAVEVKLTSDLNPWI